jgi:hypothetical protein
MLLWVAAWLCLAAKSTAAKEGDALVDAFRRLLPAFIVVTCLAAFAAAPRKCTFSVMVLWLHHTGFWLLFVFLLAGQYFQVEAWWKMRGGMSRQSVGATYRRLWIMTEIVPAPVALLLFLTGLRLIWQTHGDTAQGQGNSMSTFWLQGLVIGFAVFFWDGILGYTPIVRGLRKQWESGPAGSAPSKLSPGPQPLSEAVQLMLHLLSWPVVFLLGVFRWDFPTILTPAVESLERRLNLLPAGWPEVTTAVLLWLLMGLLVGFARILFRRKEDRTSSHGLIL